MLRQYCLPCSRLSLPIKRKAILFLYTVNERLSAMSWGELSHKLHLNPFKHPYKTGCQFERKENKDFSQQS